MASPSAIRHQDASTAPPGEPAAAQAAPAHLRRAPPPGRLVLPAEEIIDPQALHAQMAQTMARGPQSETLRRAAVEHLRSALHRGRQAILDALGRQPSDGPAAAASFTWLTDAIVIEAATVAQTWLHPRPNPTKSEHMAVLATGGYGRGEMAPFSDVDLLFLTPYKQTAWGESVIETVLYMLWDLRFKVGHAVRTVDDCLRLAREDITIRTALLERRYLTGEAVLADELETRLWTELFSRTGPEFVEAKLAERDERHRRHGGSRYLVEPNVKEGKGGLRDLQTLYWIAKYLYRAGTPEELVARGVFTEEEVAIFNAAEAFLWSVRSHLHRLSGRANELLTFDMQVEMASAMGYRAENGRRAVEIFMQAYFTHAKHVGDLTRIFCALLEARHVKSRPALIPRLRRAFGIAPRLEPGFVERDGRLDFDDRAAISETPALLLRLFREGQRSGLRLHPNAMRRAAASTAQIEALRCDPEAVAIFLELLADVEDPQRALRRMNETGALGAFVPEFGEIVCLMQFNMYHHYTVDEHTLNCLSILHQIEEGALTEDLPIASSILKGGIDRLVLSLALLLHDVGKGRPGDHSELGEKMARAVCARMGVDAGTAELVAWLVRHHLVMSDVAQKRDISDPHTVRDFAHIVKTQERLKLLLLLTVCDIKGVGPGVWNNWKAQLLRQLYRATKAELTGDADISSRAAREAAAKTAFAEIYAQRASAASVTEELERHYTGYWLGFDTDTQILFAELDEAVLSGEIAAQITPDPARDATRAVFYMEDHPGIFARLSGALAIAGANVVDARSHTTSDGYATSVFWVQDHDGKPYEKERLDRLRRIVERTLKGEVVAREEFKTRDKIKKRVRDFTVPTRVVFDNDGSDIFTIVEVSARDRPGLLYDLTRTLAAANIAISSAVVATYGAQAVDVFYVKDLFGLKILSEAKRRAIEERLARVVERGAQTG
ncbi:MAG: [protein-PII] uridylyltransferase [Pseudomonadota bacterium]